MKNSKILFMLIVCFHIINSPLWAQSIGTAFTYQGKLNDGGSRANGKYDFEFELYDALTAGSQVGSTISIDDLDVYGGYFTVSLDFGDQFNGAPRWLLIGVRLGAATDGFTLLSPRQELKPVPYAMFAEKSNWLNLLNIPPDFADGVDNIGVGDIDWLFSGDNIYSGVAGNVGIGDSTPSSKLDVNGNINTSTGYQIGLKLVLSIPSTANTFVGVNAGSSNISGNLNTFLGAGSGTTNTYGSNNTFLGQLTGSSNTAGQRNTFVGSLAGYYNDVGHDNTFVGYQTGYNNVDGLYNTFVGKWAGYSNLSSSNTFIGYQSGYDNTTGGSNIFVGYWAGRFNDTGHDNTFLGNSAGLENTSGNSNTFLGKNAGSSNTTGARNVFIGYNAGANANGSDKLYIDSSNTASPLIYGDFATDIVTINGKLGVGTTSPGALLDITTTSGGAATIGGSGTTATGTQAVALGANADATGDYSIAMGTGTTAGGSYATAIGVDINVTGTRSVGIGLGGATSTVTSNNVMAVMGGNVGIGTTTPGQKLTVAGTIESTAGGVKFPDGSVQTTAVAEESDVYFMVKRSSTYTWPDTGSDRKIDFSFQPIVWENQGNAFDTSTSRFTAPSTGIYSFSGAVWFQNLSNGDLIYCQFLIGGKTYMSNLAYASGHSQTVHANITVHLTAGQSAELWGHASSNPAAEVVGNFNPTSAFTYFSGAKVK